MLRFWPDDKAHEFKYENTWLESGTECLKILQQVAAVRGAVNGLMSELLEGHIRSHLLSEPATSEQRENDMEEIVAVIRSYMK